MNMDEEKISELDPSIWDIAVSEKVSPYFRSFVNTSMYTGKNKYFARTRFHVHFTNILKAEIETERNSLKDEIEAESNSLKDEIEAANRVHVVGRNSVLVGIQGIGKSSTAVYFVLSCIKNDGNQQIHFIDMDNVDETDLCNVDEYLSSMGTGHTLIIDHVTMFNWSLVQKIEKLALGKISKVLLIQTGFSVCVTSLDELYNFDNKWQLDRREFKTIWIECLKKVKHSLENQVIFIDALYQYCKDNFILTPRLLQRIQYIVVRHEICYDPTLECGKDVDYFMNRYLKSLSSDITDFYLEYNRIFYTENMTKEKQLCRTFSLRTKLLLHQLSRSENQDVILTSKLENLFNIALNIFHCEYGHVTDNDLENDIRYAELGFEKGDRYFKISLLMPELSDLWEAMFPFRIKEIIHNKFDLDACTVLKFCLGLGDIQKEIEEELVNLQYKMRFLILPAYVKATRCRKVQGASEKCKLYQCNEITVTTLINLIHYCPSLSDIADYENMAVRMGYRSHDKNVAKMALYIKNIIDRNSDTSLLVYPAISNLKGIHYIVYTENHSLSQSNETPERKKQKMSNSYALYLIQVATGATHSGDTIGEALNTFKNIIKNVPIHVVIFIARKELNEYTLSGHMAFENISVINLAHLSLKGWLEKNELLYGIEKLIRESSGNRNEDKM